MRTDEHRPSAIIPTDYEYVAESYIKVESLGDALCLKVQRERIAKHRTRTGGDYAKVETAGNCQVCGSVNAIYTSLFWHRPSNTYVRMGHDCADKCDMGGSFERNTFRRALEDVRHAQAGKRKAQALLADAGLSAAWDIYMAEYDSLPRDPKTARPERKETTGGTEETFPAFAGVPYYEETTIRDIVGKFVRYGSISDAAMGLLRKLTERIPDRDKRQAEWEAKRKAEKEAAAPCPKGRVKIEGTVLKVEERETQWGFRTVMTVKSTEGFIVWCSVPSGIVVEKDCKIVFVATVTPSDNDPKFGFGKRPALYESKEEKKAKKNEQKRTMEESF
jgi:hypothetical protein